MKAFGWLLAGAGFGAGTMFLLDPQGGGRRRAFVRDKSLHHARAGYCATEKLARDVRNRLMGLIAEVEALGAAEWVDDDTLVARVRAALGHVTTHTHAIEVVAKGSGLIELKGPIPPSEKARALAAVRAVRGVTEIDDDLRAEFLTDEEPALES